MGRWNGEGAVGDAQPAGGIRARQLIAAAVLVGLGLLLWRSAREWLTAVVVFGVLAVAMLNDDAGAREGRDAPPADEPGSAGTCLLRA